MAGIIYFISDGEYMKIGITMDIKARFQQLQSANARNLLLLKAVEFSSYKEAQIVEKKLHNYFVRYKERGEWFNIILNNSDIEKVLDAVWDKNVGIRDITETRKSIYDILHDRYVEELQEQIDRTMEDFYL